MRRCLLLLALTACARPSTEPTTPAAPVTPSEAPSPAGRRVLGATSLRMPGPIQHVAFVGDAIVAVSKDGTVRFFDREDGEAQREIRLDAPVWQAALAREGLLLGLDDDVLRTLDLTSGATRDTERPGRLIAASADRRFFAHDEILIAERGGEGRRIELPRRVAHVDAHHDGRFVAVGVQGAALLFEPGAIEAAHGLAAGGNGAVAIDPRNRWVVVEDPAANLRLGVWSLASGERVRELARPQVTGSLLRFSPDGRFLALVAMEELFVWRTEDWQQTAHREGLAHVRSLSFSADGSELALGGNANTVRVFASASGEERLGAFGHRGNVESLRWGADGTLYSGGRFDGQVIAWSPAGEGRVLADLGHALVESVIPTERGLWALTTDALHPVGVDGRSTPVELQGIGRAGAACEGGICLLTSEGLYRWSGALERVLDLGDSFDPPFSPDGDRVLIRDGNAMVLRQTSDGATVARYETDGCLFPAESALSGDAVAVYERTREGVESDAAGRVVLRDRAGEIRASVAVPATVGALAFVGDDAVALASPTGVHLWRPGHVPALRTLSVGPAHSLAWGEETLAVGLTDGRILLLELDELREAPAVTTPALELPSDCERGTSYGVGGLGLVGGGGGGRGPDRRYFGMFADPHHRP